MTSRVDVRVFCSLRSRFHENLRLFVLFGEIEICACGILVCFRFMFFCIRGFYVMSTFRQSFWFDWCLDGIVVFMLLCGIGVSVGPTPQTDGRFSLHFHANIAYFSIHSHSILENLALHSHSIN